MVQTSQSGESIELVRETGAEMFVINLCASTTPVTLAHPATAELKRFTFFVTRRREEGRERFRLHMGYFTSLTEAESMLPAVRDVYPAAWAGPAPESRAPAARATARPAMKVVPASKPVSIAATPAAPGAAPVAEVAAAKPIVATPVAAASTVPSATPAASKATVELESMSNVREVLAQLADDSPVPKAAPAAAPAPKASQEKAATLTAAETLRVLETPAPAAEAALAPAAKAASVSASRGASAPVAPLPAAPAIDFASNSSANQIRILTPEDTQTLRDIKLDAQRDAPASFAVQLVWAVQPIDMDALPHLAIFDAYTLYHVEGSRQGRKWYGLRLGFFSDPSAAKQVAQYVRSEYASVAVVPVTAKEKDGAKAPTLSAAAIQQPAAPRNETPKIPTVKPLEKPVAKSALEGFELLPDEPAAKKRDLDDGGADTPARNEAAKGAPRAAGKAPGKRAVARPPARKPAPPGAPQPLESTLEILGASTLTIDESREIINDAAARRPPPKKDKPGRFARLLNRLSDKKD